MNGMNAASEEGEGRSILHNMSPLSSWKASIHFDILRRSHDRNWGVASPSIFIAYKLRVLSPSLPLALNGGCRLDLHEHECVRRRHQSAINHFEGKICDIAVDGTRHCSHPEHQGYQTYIWYQRSYDVMRCIFCGSSTTSNGLYRDNSFSVPRACASPRQFECTLEQLFMYVGQED